jgi:penicillin-binding protein 1B
MLLFFIWGSGIIVYLAESKLLRLVPGGWGESFSTKIYATPSVIRNESHLPLNELIARLQHVGYQPTKLGKLVPGEYNWSDPILTVSIRGFSAPHASQDPGVFKFVHWEGSRWEVKSQEGKSVNQVTLEPEIIAELSGPLKVRREPVNWYDVPPHLVDAVISIEDRRFYSHHGVDFRSIARAALNDIKHRKKIQGGSTITQQLAKNLFLTHRRTISRKILEAFFALYLDLRYSKQEVLTLYLNHIYLGQDGFFSVAGVKSAAQYYFGKDVKNLDLAESALLAGLIRSPYRYNPRGGT